MSWFRNPQKQIQREGSGQVAYLGNDSSERQQGSGEKRQGSEGGQSLACEQAGHRRGWLDLSLRGSWGVV